MDRQQAADELIKAAGSFGRHMGRAMIAYGPPGPGGDSLALFSPEDRAALAVDLSVSMGLCQEALEAYDEALGQPQNQGSPSASD